MSTSLRIGRLALGSAIAAAALLGIPAAASATASAAQQGSPAGDRNQTGTVHSGHSRADCPPPGLPLSGWPFDPFDYPSPESG